MRASKAEHSEAERLYDQKEVVEYYASVRPLLPVEEDIFSHYLSSKDRVLDLGMGGGCTTAAFGQRVLKYVGIDIAEQMVEVCQKRFPSLEFLKGDASDLSRFETGSFDAVVFSLNGLDCLSLAGRIACIREVFRVLRPGGHFIFSSHNPRRLLVKPRFRGASLERKIWRSLRSTLLTGKNIFLRSWRRTYWSGQGFLFDDIHGGRFSVKQKL